MNLLKFYISQLIYAESSLVFEKNQTYRLVTLSGLIFGLSKIKVVEVQILISSLKLFYKNNVTSKQQTKKSISCRRRKEFERNP